MNANPSVSAPLVEFSLSVVTIASRRDPMIANPSATIPTPMDLSELGVVEFDRPWTGPLEVGTRTPCSGGGEAPEMGTPHFVQNVYSSGTSAPHLPQNIEHNPLSRVAL